MRRREFLALLGGAAAFEPVATHAQTAGAAKRIGVLIGLSSADPAGQAEMTAFRDGLAALGWTEGRNLKVEYRWPGSDPERIPRGRERARRAGSSTCSSPAPRRARSRCAARPERRRSFSSSSPSRWSPASCKACRGRAATSPASPILRPASAANGWSSLKAVAPQVSRVALMYNPRTAPFAPNLHAQRGGRRPHARAGVQARREVSGQNDIEVATEGLATPPGGGLPFTLTDSFMTGKPRPDHRDCPRFTASPRSTTIANFSAERRPDRLRRRSPRPVPRAAGYVDRILAARTRRTCRCRRRTSSSC